MPYIRISLLELAFNFDQLSDTVIHFLDSVIFSKTHATLVGDVVNATFRFSVLATGAADLKVELARDFFQLCVV